MVSGIEAISENAALAEIASSGNAAARPAGGDFADWFASELSKTNEQIQAADKAVTDLVLGETDNLHQVMITLEKAKLSFELMVEVRNKALEAYQEVMRMQI